MDDRIIDAAERFSTLPDAEGQAMLAELPPDERDEVMFAAMMHATVMAGMLGTLAAGVPQFVSADDPLLDAEQQMAVRAIEQMRGLFWRVIRKLPAELGNDPETISAAMQQLIESDPAAESVATFLRFSRSAARRA